MAKAKQKPVPVEVLLQRLAEKYPDARYELNWETPLQLLVATILAAQCTDERINKVTPGLFKKYPDAKSFAKAKLATLEVDLKPTGFYRNKAKAVQGMCKALVEKHGGEVPKDINELILLPGVARKTANVVLNNAFKIPSGVIVDGHVARVVQRMGLVQAKKTTKAEKIELQLMHLIPMENWVAFGPAMVLHGRYTCTAQKPDCENCIFNDQCPKLNLPVEKPKKEKAASKKTPTSKKTPMAKKKKTSSESTESSEVEAPVTSVTTPTLPASWQKVLAPEFEKPYFQKLMAFVEKERQDHEVFPPAEDVYNSFKFAPYDKVKVLLLGQDPYHDNGQAHGLCFSVKPPIKPPPSLVNMFKELKDDLGCTIPNHGFLEGWAKQGILMLNAVLTVQAHKAGSHSSKGWETFTDAVIKALNEREKPVVFVLWGGYAQKKEKLIDATKHKVLKSAHPSPLSQKMFLGSKPFSAINKALKDLGETPINWQLPNI
jgi:uracil-DNA glycosylase